MDQKQVVQNHVEERRRTNGKFANQTEEDFVERYHVHDLLQSSDAEQGLNRRVDGELVTVKRRAKHNPFLVASARREIAALTVMSEPSIQSMREWFESEASIWTVLNEKPSGSVREYIHAHGPLSPDAMKSTMTQLFAALACIFSAGFTHLRICDETVYLSAKEHLMITDFQYAHEYGHEKIDTLYAPVSDKYGEDIYVAPEVFSTVKYNGRKATIWSCGVLTYFMTTGQTEKLSTLGHPSFEGQVDKSVSSSRRRLSSASQQAFHAPLIVYPQNRLAVPSWTRDIISKMLITDPLRRAELIEVTSKVPKELAGNFTRPLMELAWLDYKQHVGPLAGLELGRDDAASSFSFSGFSSWSKDSLGALLPGRRRSTIVTVKGEGEASRRKSLWK